MSKPLTGADNDFLRIVLPACSAGRLSDVKRYVQVKPEFAHRIGPHGRTMLWEAARKGKTEVVRFLAEEQTADAMALGCYYRETRVEISPWLVATLNRRKETAEYLESRGCGIDFFASIFLGDQKRLKRFLENDLSIANRPYVREHRWNSYQIWPLQYAIAGKQLGTFQTLLNSGAAADADPRILFDAIDTSQIKMAELLLAAGADPLASQHRDWWESPKFNALARRFGHSIQENDLPPQKWPEIVDASRGNHNAPDDPSRVLEFIKAGHDVNVRDYKGKTALHRASQAGFAQISQLLIKHGACLHAESLEGETPLFDAAFYGRVDQIDLLIRLGAKLEHRNLKEETPLFAAVRGGRVESIRQLIKSGADLRAVDAKGKSVRDIAERSKKEGVLEAIRQTRPRRKK